MANERSVYSDSRYLTGLEISKTGDLFRRYTFIEQACVRALAGWFLKVPEWEAKLQLGHFLFSHAERVYELQGRLEELRGGNREVNIEPLLERLAGEIVLAPGGKSFVAGLSLVLQKLAQAYRSHLEGANPAANGKEIRILQRLLPDVEREIAELGKLGSMIKPQIEEDTRQWSDYLESLIHAMGGLNGMGAKGEVNLPDSEPARFEWPSSIIFDERLRNADLGSYESKLELPLRERCIGEFEVYFNEMYAAAIVASVIYDSWKLTAPRQYFMDIAHQFWDEVRHAEFGAIRLMDLGIVPNKVNMMLYEQSRTMPILHRYCYLTLGLEVFFMPRKSVRVRYCGEQGDDLSQLLADVDWSEEINHVRYGKRWIEYFLMEDSRSVEDIQAEISQYLAEYAAQLPIGKKAPW